MNVERKEGFSQVCLWPGTLVGKSKIKDFEEFMLKELGVHIQYLEEIETFPDRDELGREVPGTGGRNDVLFAVFADDVGSFAVSRLSMGIRWIEDVLADCNYSSPIYPERVFEYKTW